MSSISIIGLGKMASTLADRALSGGNAVEIVGRDPAKAKELAGALGGATVGTAAAAVSALGAKVRRGDLEDLDGPRRFPKPDRRSPVAGCRRVISGTVRLRPASGRGRAAGRSRRRDGSAPC